MTRNTFPFPVDPADLFEERGPQMVSWGIPRATVASVRSRVRDMWAESKGGWAFEWMTEAARAEQQHRWYRAAMCYGAAKFPCISTDLQRRAFERQLDCYLRASARFPCGFERRELTVPCGGEITTKVAAHLFSPRGSNEQTPLVCLSGGVDTLKIELHRLALAIALAGRFRVAVIDMPGTGESALHLREDSHLVYEGVINALRGPATTPAAIWGVSFGGHWAAKLACRATVNAAVDMGGPVEGKLIESRDLPNGMPGILANALGADLSNWTDALAEQFSLRALGLLAQPSSTPLLVLNGAHDPYVPMEDLFVFSGWPNSTVWVFRDGSHCAANLIKRVVPAALAWLSLQLRRPRVVDRIAYATAKLILPARVARLVR